MTIPRDKIMHAAAGVITLLAGAAVLAVFEFAGPGAAAALATTLVGVGYELQQRLRGDGEPSWADAAVTAAPGWFVWGVLAVLP